MARAGRQGLNHPLTYLERTRLSSAYRRRLRLCWKTRLAWLVTLPFDCTDYLNSASAMDTILVQFVDFCYRAEVAQYICKRGVLLRFSLSDKAIPARVRSN